MSGADFGSDERPKNYQEFLDWMQNASELMHSTYLL
jgi:hypothetical protein